LLSTWAAREAAHPTRPQSSAKPRDPDSEALTTALIALIVTAGVTAAVLTGWVPTPLAP